MRFSLAVHCSKLLLVCVLGAIAFRTARVEAQSIAATDEYIAHQWTVNDGLPVNEISDIAQTQEGYMWLTTFDGLVRFDGDQFKVFNTVNTSALPTNRFAGMVVDADNNLWILTDRIGNTEMLLRYRDGAFAQVGPEGGFQGSVVLGLDAKGRLMVSAENGGWYHEQGTLQSFGPEVEGKLVRDIAHGPDGAYWFATNQGVYRQLDGSWTELREADGLTTNDIYAVYPSPTGKVWMGSQHELMVWENNQVTETVTFPVTALNELKLQGNPFRTNEISILLTNRSTYTYRDGEMIPRPGPEFQETYRHNFSYLPSGALWMHTTNKLFRNDTLVYASGGQINAFYHDHEGNIWVSSTTGLVQLKPRLLKAYQQNLSTVYVVAEDDQGEVWATRYQKELCRLQADTFQPVPDNAGIEQLTYSLCPASDGVMWIGTSDGIYRWDQEHPALKFTERDREYDGALLRGIKSIVEDKAGNLWLGGVYGLHQLDQAGEWHFYGKAEEDDETELRVVYLGGDGTLYAGTNGHGVLYLKQGELHPIPDNQKLSGNIVRSIYEDADGVLWVGTEGWGLNRIEDGMVAAYNKQNGLFDNVVHQILEDDDGRLWMNSNRGVFWVNRSELGALARGEASSIHSFAYNEQDGLPGREGNGGMHPAGIKSRQGELWFPMMGGVVRIDPNQVKIAPIPVFIEEVSTADSTYRAGMVAQLAIPTGQRDLRITFTALNFATSPDNVKYRYQLEGRDNDWMDAGQQKEAVYSNLDPGTYTFAVMANNGGGWSVNQSTLEITIPPFFYETFWFYAILVLVVIGVFYTGVSWRIRILKKKGKELELRVEERTQQLRKEKEETVRQKDIATEALITIEKQAAELLELDKMKSHFFTNVSHEFRTPLTLIIAPLEDQIAKLKAQAKGDTEDMELALKNSKRLMRLVNQLLDIAKMESGQMAMKARSTDLRGLVESVTESFLSLAERNGTQLIIRLPDSPVMASIDTDLIEKALMNLVSNAFKFTAPQGVVRVQLAAHDDEVVISVQDNGEGISEEDQKHVFERFHQVNESVSEMQMGTGIGLSHARELVSLHGGRMAINSTRGFGTEFLIYLPAEEAGTESIGTLEPLHHITAAPKTVARPTTVPSDLPADTDQPILLIVEDNADIRQYVRKQFDAEYHILEAENGHEGLKLAKAALPDLIISDVMMPVMDGYALCKAVKEDPDLDFIPLILLTAKAESNQKIEGLKTGADDYIVKPFKVDELDARVSNLIQSRKKLKERLAGMAPPAPTPDPIGWGDSAFARQARAALGEHVDDENFSVSQWAGLLKVGRTTLYSRVLELTEKSPADVIKLTRIYRASDLLKEGHGNISEVAYSTGFKSVSHFSKTFREVKGLTPSEYKRSTPQSAH